MFHIIYRTTNLITGKWYIGMHSSKKQNDGYLGSGKILVASLNKYGRENHKREIIASAPSREQLREMERMIVTEGLILDPMCMNLAPGGCGSGFGRKVRPESKLKMSESANKRWARGIPEELRELGRKRRGVDSPRSKTWSLQAPDGKRYLTSACNDFCLERGLAYFALRNKAITKDTTPIVKGASKGWSVLSCTARL